MSICLPHIVDEEMFRTHLFNKYPRTNFVCEANCHVNSRDFAVISHQKCCRKANEVEYYL